MERHKRHLRSSKRNVPAPLPGTKELDHLLGLELKQLLEVDAAVGEAPERAALGAVVGGCGGSGSSGVVSHLEWMEKGKEKKSARELAGAEKKGS